jgi:alpha-L-rhamnosidase
MKYLNRNGILRGLLTGAFGLVISGNVLGAPIITTNTLPATTIDVVGSVVKFTATFSSALPISHQWQVIRNGTTNDIPGATSPTLTLLNLQTNDTGWYRLRAMDSQGVTFSAMRSLTVNPAAIAEGNIITSFAAQTGLGSGGTNFFPTWSVTTGSLIAGLAPTSVGAGNFSQWGGGTVAVLTDNSIGQFNFIPNVGGSATEVTCGTFGGQSVTYTLPNVPSGYDLTNIVVYGGWGDAGRDQQSYTISYATVAAPGTFTAFKSVSYNPVNSANVQCATRVTLSPASNTPLAGNVVAVRFDFTSPAPENGYCGYSEINLFGEPTGVPPVANLPTSSHPSPITAGTIVTVSASVSGVPPFLYQWQTDNGSSGAFYSDLAGATNASYLLNTTNFGNFALSYRVRVTDVNGSATSPALLLTITNPNSTISAATLNDLRGEHLSNPLGLDVARPRLSWKLNATERGARQTAYQILVASSQALLAQGQGDLWNSGVVVSDQSVLVQYGGQPLTSGQLCHWKVRAWDRVGNYSAWSAPAKWSMGLLIPSDWTASWIGMPTDTSITPAPPSPMLRKGFTISKPVARATAYICGLGYYEMLINGAKISDHVLDPTWTRYEKQANYVTHDVTTNLVSGANAIGVQLANGFYNQWSTDAWNTFNAPWRALPQMLLQLDIEFTDGTTQRVVSDTTWKTATGPLLLDATRLGEVYDARLEKTGWATVGYSDSTWTNAILREGTGGDLIAPNAEPIKVVKTIAPVRIIPVSGQPGVYTFDFGQNLTGWGKLTVSGSAGTTVNMVFGEKTNSNGSVDLANINVYVNSQQAYFQKDIYILKGGGTEIWEPRFTYHGFQYVQVSGLPSVPTTNTLVARVVNTAFEDAGSFLCSNDLLNRIETNTLWSYLGNFTGIPTDCPHREKNGWLGDAQLAAEIGLTHYKSAAAYTRWIRDFRVGQEVDGGLYGVIPNPVWGANVGPPWESAYLFIPWFVYQHTGDLGILTNNYDGMKAYVNYLGTRASGNIVSFGLGDWLPASTTTSTALTGTSYYYHDALILAQTAALMGKTSDALQYSNLAAQIKISYNNTLYNPTNHQYAGGTQTAQSSALYHGLVETNQVAGVVGVLAANVQQNGNRIDTGILGSKYILRTLCDNGRPDVAFALATQTAYPSWGYKITKGATTLWETWHGTGTIDSLNHVMFGDISAWMMQYIAGIRPGMPGYKQVLIRPELMNGLAWAQATHASPYGTISSAWELSGSNATLNVTIPPNATAKVHVPLLGTAATNVVVREGGTIIWQNGAAVGNVDGIEFAQLDNALPQQFLVWNVGAGSYQFTWQVAIQVPGGLFASAGDRQVNLGWNPVLGATSYNLKRSLNTNGPFTLLTNVTTGVNCEDRAVTNGLTYHYVVSAITTNGESADSVAASAMPKLDLNLGFESKQVSNYEYNSSGAIWAFNGATDNGSGLIANGSGFSNPNAPEGTQAAFVQRLGTMSQMFSGFSPGTMYTIRFAAAQRPGPNQNGGQSWDVKIDGSTIASYNPGASATAYADYTASFTATATNHTLIFAGSNLAGGDNTMFVDNIRFTPPMPPTNPVVALTSPANASSLLAPASLSLMASVVTNDNFISGVRFYSSVTNLLAQDNSPPYAFAWNNVPAGNYQVRAQVLFNGTNVVDSPSVNLVVTNMPTVIESVGLVDGKFFLSGGGQPGQLAVLLTTLSLGPPVNWLPVATNPPEANGSFSFSNLLATNLQQYFRVTTP